jgi:hypothetical protein
MMCEPASRACPRSNLPLLPFRCPMIAATIGASPDKAKAPAQSHHHTQTEFVGLATHALAYAEYLLRHSQGEPSGLSLDFGVVVAAKIRSAAVDVKTGG